MTRLLLAATIVFLAQLTASAESLAAVLARMDQSAAQFHSMTANLQMVNHTAILDDDTTETGVIKMQKSAGGTEALIDFTGSKDSRTLGFFDKTIQLYFPKLNLVQVYKLGKKANLLDQYLLLGFGTSGTDLKKGYQVELAGAEQVGGQNTSKLLLVPKDKGIKANIEKAEIWLPSDSGNPVQQKFYLTSGNYRLLTYTNFKLNPPLGSLKLNTPPNTKVENPQ
jgi:outer membrane lipoprotein-sorting protein